jgi:uroporphyrinogen decarboxylase
MTKRERYLAFANFQPVDRIPRYAGYVGEMFDKMKAHCGGEDPAVYFDNDGGWAAGLTPPDGYVAPDYSVYHQEFINDPNFSIDGNGCGHLNHGFYHFTEYISPLRNATRFEELEAYPLISNADWSDAKMAASRDAAHAAGRPSVLWVGHMYESAWQVRGYEPFLEDLLLQPEWSDFLLDHYMRNNIRAATAAARHGYDAITVGDDVANQNALMFTPKMWREVMKPRWAKVFAEARAIKPDLIIWYHSDGNVFDILGDLIEIGVTILNPVQPECMNPLEVRKYCGKHLAFDGCVGTQSTFPFGTPTDVRANVRELVETLDGGNGGLMLSPTHVLEPEVSVDNVVAFFDECDRVLERV